MALPSKTGTSSAGWEAPYWEGEAGKQMDADVEASDALLLGRTTYDIFRNFWPGQPGKIGRTFDRVPKVRCVPRHARALLGRQYQISDAAAQVPELRERHQLIHVWGSGNLLQTLFREGLVDQVNMWVYPVVIGEGKRLFPEGTAAIRFELVEPPTVFPGGSMLQRYRRVEGRPATGTSAEVEAAAR